MTPNDWESLVSCKALKALDFTKLMYTCNVTAGSIKEQPRSSAEWTPWQCLAGSFREEQPVQASRQLLFTRQTGGHLAAASLYAGLIKCANPPAP